MTRLTLVAVNAARHDAAFDAVRAAGADVVHAAYPTSWEEVSARRTGAPLRAAETVPDALQAALARADAVFGFALPRDLPALAPGLRWVATPAAGIDHLRGTGVLEAAAIAVTTTGGLFAGVIAEHVFAGILHFAKRLATFEAQRRERRWKMTRVGALEGRTVGLVGVGHIGRAVAARARAFGMRVLGLGRSDPRGRHVPGVDRLLGRTALPELLASADYAVVAVADTPATRGLLGAAEIARLRPEAVLVNVARGTVLDESALVAALRAGRLAGAALDVFAEEPLPPASPLWELPNVLLTPHVAANVEDYLPRAIARLAENVPRFLAGAPLLDRLDRERGY
ncbi:MAG TPA: D-2-hydroxyacid dehydrogenase [Candidatus Binatia bacterium]|nr:D-2-hydroxyacid dehydrogenase [Candidatus Binatia bacterium]